MKQAQETKTFAPLNRIINSLKLDIINLQEKIERLQDQGISSFKACNELYEKTEQLDQFMKFAQSRS